MESVLVIPDLLILAEGWAAFEAARSVVHLHARACLRGYYTSAAKKHEHARTDSSTVAPCYNEPRFIESHTVTNEFSSLRRGPYTKSCPAIMNSRYTEPKGAESLRSLREGTTVLTRVARCSSNARACPARAHTRPPISSLLRMKVIAFSSNTDDGLRRHGQ